MYTSQVKKMNFDITILVCHQHLKQDIEYFHHPRKLYHALFQSIYPWHPPHTEEITDFCTRD